MIASRPILERVTHVAPFGVRFWDPVYLTSRVEGLVVTAYQAPAGATEPDERFGRPLPLVPNRSGTYVLHHAPGLAEFERGTGDADSWAALPAARPSCFFVVDDPA